MLLMCFLKHLFNNFQNITIDKSDNEVPFLLKMSEFILHKVFIKTLAYLLKIFQLHKIILKLMINQMINEAKLLHLIKIIQLKLNLKV